MFSIESSKSQLSLPPPYIFINFIAHIDQNYNFIVIKTDMLLEEHSYSPLSLDLGHHYVVFIDLIFVITHVGYHFSLCYISSQHL